MTEQGVRRIAMAMQTIDFEGSGVTWTDLNLEEQANYYRRVGAAVTAIEAAGFSINERTDSGK